MNLKKPLIASVLIASAVIVPSCAPPPRVTPFSARVAAGEEPLTRATADRVLTELLPGMGATEVAERERPQQQLEQICFRAGRPGADNERTALCEALAARLGPGTAHVTRIWLLRQLERVSGTESVPAVARLLAEDNPEIRDAARRVLQNCRSAQAGRTLWSALRSATTPEWRVALINALAARGDREYVPDLATLLSDPDGGVSVAAAAALGDIGGPAALDALWGAWRESDGARQVAMTTALLRIAERPGDDAVRRRALGIFWAVVETPPTPELQQAALRDWAAAGGVEALPMLLDLVNDPDTDDELRAVAANAVAEVPGEAVTLLIAQRLRGAPVKGQILLVRALGARGDAAALPVIVPLLDSEEEDLQLAALQALATLGDRTCVQRLAEIAASTTGAPHDAARKSLARLRGEAVDRVLLAGLEQTTPAQRIEYIVALRARNCRIAVPVLLNEARHADEQVRTAAFEALGMLGSLDTLPALIRLLRDADPETVCTAAENAIVSIDLRIDNPETRWQPLRSAWTTATPKLRASLVRIMGRVGGHEALDTIRAARRSDDATLVDAAVRALSSWVTADVLDDLQDIVTNSPEKTHRVLALQGWCRLLELPSDREPQATAALYAAALDTAERPEERKQALGGLAKVPHLDALMTAQRWLTDDGVKAEAESAVLNLAPLVAPLHRAEAVAAVQQVIALAQADASGDAVQKAMKEIRATEGNIVAWSVSGPYIQSGADAAWVYRHAFPPEHANARDVMWRELAPSNAPRPWVFDLTKLDRGENRCVYVRSVIWSPDERRVLLLLGSDDGVRAWLNGTLVYELQTTRAHTPLSDRVPVTLRKGWNTLLLKVVQVAGEWGCSAGIRTLEGEPPAGLRFAAEVPKP